MSKPTEENRFFMYRKKISDIPLESLIESLHANFQGGVESLHWNFQGGVESLHANFQSNFQGSFPNSVKINQPPLESLHANFQPPLFKTKRKLFFSKKCSFQRTRTVCAHYLALLLQELFAWQSLLFHPLEPWFLRRRECKSHVPSRLHKIPKALCKSLTPTLGSGHARVFPMAAERKIENKMDVFSWDVEKNLSQKTLGPQNVNFQSCVFISVLLCILWCQPCFIMAHAKKKAILQNRINNPCKSNTNTAKFLNIIANGRSNPCKSNTKTIEHIQK